jgi:phospholipase/carboxylesterase
MPQEQDPPHSAPLRSPGFSRREFLASAVAGMAATLGACQAGPAEPIPDGPGRITARPTSPSRQHTIGFSPLGLSNQFTGRDGLIYVPASYRPDRPAPLLILLHGGGRSSADWETPALAALADSVGAVVLAPDSRSLFTWDIVESRNYATDLPYLNQALVRTFSKCRIDGSRVAMVGFSDGASAALSLGLANGDFTRSVVAFSPGFLDDRYFRGKPRVFVSHGNSDPVLSFASTQDEIVPFLLEQDLEVVWAPFTGGHTIPDSIASQAFGWLEEGWSSGG